MIPTIIPIAPNSWIAYAEICHSSFTLKHLLPSSLRAAYEPAEPHSEKRQREWWGSKVLIYLTLGRRAFIKYHPSGKPQLHGIQGNISISHSGNYIVLMYSRNANPVGIDIEQIGEKVPRIIQRFFSPFEQKQSPPFLSEKLHGVWCAKEALFKTSDCDVFRFDDYLIQSITITPQKNIHGTAQTPLGLTSFHGFQRRNFIILWTQLNFQCQ